MYQITIVFRKYTASSPFKASSTKLTAEVKDRFDMEDFFHFIGFNVPKARQFRSMFFNNSAESLTLTGQHRSKVFDLQICKVGSCVEKTNQTN